MASMTKAQLLDELAKLRHNYELLEQKCIGLANDMSAISVQRDVAEHKVEHLEEVLASHGVAKQFTAVCGKNTESPAYISEPFATEQAAWDDCKRTGYPITNVEASWVKAVVPERREVPREAPRVRSANRSGQPRTVFEFDPAKPGDFKRASEAARLNGGCVRRAGDH